MEDTSPNVSYELTNTIIALQHTARTVRQKIEKEQQELVFDVTQPIGHLLDSTNASDILNLARPTSETTQELSNLESKLTTLQNTLEERKQWLPPTQTTSIPCSTDFLDLSDLSNAVNLVTDVITYSNPSTQITPRKAFASKTWTWDPLWREFFSTSQAADGEPATTLYLSRWYFDPRSEVWHHANMAESGLLPDEAQQRLGSWEDWSWDPGCGEWGLNASGELEEEEREQGAKLCIFASKWQEREGVWVYVGARGG